MAQAHPQPARRSCGGDLTPEGRHSPPLDAVNHPPPAAVRLVLLPPALGNLDVDALAREGVIPLGVPLKSDLGTERLCCAVATRSYGMSAVWS